MTEPTPVNLWFAIPSDAKPGTYILSSDFISTSQDTLVDTVGQTNLKFPLLIGPGATEHVAVAIDTGEIVRRWSESET